MKLNPSKCAFGVSSGKFLGFMVSQKEIEANPEKVRVILEMSSPKTVKEVQSLTGRVAKRCMARGVTKRPVGLQDYSTNTNKRDALQSNLRNRSKHPSQSGTH